MRHSDFSEVLYAIKKTELKEFREALETHGGQYFFLSEHDILHKNFEEDDEICPHVYVTGGSNVSRAHELIVHYVEIDEENGQVYVRGRAFYEDTLSYSVDWQIEQGSWYDIMDKMDDPEED